jgi:hypothetical protein
MFDAGAARKIEEQLFVQRDRRADGGARRVRVTRSDILIARRFGGVEMMIAVPVPAYCGVALDVSEGRDGAPCYRLSLAHRDADLDVLLAETQDGGAAAAEWKYWAAWLGLPRVTNEDGEFASVDPALGGEVSIQRRRNATVAKRRPRFLLRRKAGDAARMDEVFAGEREIICYE